MTDQPEGQSTGWTNYPQEGSDAAMREVWFGPPSSNVAILIEYDIDEDHLEVTVGNGPSHDEAPEGVAGLLRDVASIVSTMGESDEYAELVAEQSNNPED